MLILPTIPGSAWAQAGYRSVKAEDPDEAELRALASVLADTSQPQNQRFEQALFHILQLEGYRRGGPDTLFSKRPNWFSYLLIYLYGTEGYPSFLPEYKHADLSFLVQWSKGKGPKQLCAYLETLGYIPKSGLPRKRKISESHRRQILQFATELYRSPANAT